MPDNINELASQLGNPPEENNEEGKEEEENFLEIDGEKWQEDPDNPGEVLRDNDDNPVPFEEEDIKEDKKVEKEKGGEKFEMPDKFKGKTPEEIAKSYIEIEKMVDKKAEERAEEIVKEKLKAGGKKEDNEEKGNEFKGTYPMKDGKIDIPSMTPDQFKDFLLEQIDQKAEAIAKKIYTDSSKVRDTVTTEISKAQKDHPLLKTSEAYRNLALAILEASASKGKPIELKEACERVDGLLDEKKKITETEEKKLKKAKLDVETTPGASPGGENKSEGDNIREKMLQGSPTGPLGGL